MCAALPPGELQDQRGENEQDDLTHVHFSGELKYKGNAPVQIEGNGNGPVAAFCDAMNQTEVASYQFVDYSEHAISVGSRLQGHQLYSLKESTGEGHFRYRRQP